MREMMNSQFGRAEATAAFLLQSELSGSPVLIPGEFVRRGRASAGPLDGTDTRVTGHPADVGLSDRERLVYEREGGGAPGERSGGGSRAFLRRFWRKV